MPKHSGTQRAICSGVPGGGEPGGGEAGAGDRQRDAGAAPVQLLGVDHAELPVGVGAHALQVLEPVEAPLASLLDDLPGGRLVGVVLGGDRPDHLAWRTGGSAP